MMKLSGNEVFKLACPFTCLCLESLQHCGIKGQHCSILAHVVKGQVSVLPQGILSYQANFSSKILKHQQAVLSEKLYEARNYSVTNILRPNLQLIIDDWEKSKVQLARQEAVVPSQHPQSHRAYPSQQQPIQLGFVRESITFTSNPLLFSQITDIRSINGELPANESLFRAQCLLVYQILRDQQLQVVKPILQWLLDHILRCIGCKEGRDLDGQIYGVVQGEVFAGAQGDRNIEGKVCVGKQDEVLDQKIQLISGQTTKQGHFTHSRLLVQTNHRQSSSSPLHPVLTLNPFSAMININYLASSTPSPSLQHKSSQANHKKPILPIIILFMNFQERFQGKISTVGKRGLKHTLFQPKSQPPLVTPRPHLLSNYRRSESPPPTPESLIPLRRQSTQQELLVGEKELLSTHASSRRSESVNSRQFGTKAPPSFLDEMLEKHKNLLSLIDRRSSYRA